MTRVLLLSTTTGYQLRSFGEAAERAGHRAGASRPIAAITSTIRGATRAMPVRFHEEDASLAGDRGRGAARGRSTACSPSATGRRARGARGARRWACRAIRPRRPRASAQQAAGARSASLRRACRCRGSSTCRAPSADRGATIARRALPVRRQAARAVGQPRRDPRGHAGASSTPRSSGVGALLSRPDVRAMRSGLERHDPDRGLHRRARVRGRRRAHATARCSALRHLRQARSARRPVLRGDDLRHAVARCRPRRSRRSLDHVQRAARRARA